MSTKNMLSKDEVLHLSKLANLTLSDAEIKKYGSQLAETIDYVKNLDELKTEKVTPTNSVVNLSNVSFEDGSENTRGLSQQEALSNGKTIVDNSFSLGRIM